MEQSILEFVQLFGLGGTALLMFVWTMRYRSKIEADAYKHREQVESQTRDIVNEIALSQSRRADKLEDTLRERESELTAKQLEILTINQKQKEGELLFEDSQRRLQATEKLLGDERGKIRGLNAVISRMGEQMDLLKARVEQLEKDALAEREKYTTLETDMKAQQAALKLAQNLEHELKRINDELRAENFALQTANDELRKQLDNVRAENDELKRRISHIEAQLASDPR